VKKDIDGNLSNQGAIVADKHLNESRRVRKTHPSISGHQKKASRQKRVIDACWRGGGGDQWIQVAGSPGKGQREGSLAIFSRIRQTKGNKEVCPAGISMNREPAKIKRTNESKILSCKKGADRLRKFEIEGESSN